MNFSSELPNIANTSNIPQSSNMQNSNMSSNNMNNNTSNMQMNMSTINSSGLTDKDIASDLLKDSKFGLSGLTMAISESSNPQLRALLSEQLNKCISSHHRLSDLVIKKNWYPAYEDPLQQVQGDMQEAQNILR